MESSRPRLRFTLRALLLLITAAAIALGWYANRVHRQRQTVALIHRLGGSLQYKYQFDRPRSDPDPTPPAPRWLHGLLGDDWFATVVAVNVAESAVTDAELRQIAELADLVALDLSSTQITDAGLRHIGKLEQLVYLDIQGAANVTDRGIAHLAGLTRLRSLWTNGTQMTDAALVHYRNMHELGSIGLASPVTSACIPKLAHLENVRQLTLMRMPLEKKYIQGLANYDRLRTVYLVANPISREDADHIAQTYALNVLFTPATFPTDNSPPAQTSTPSTYQPK